MDVDLTSPEFVCQSMPSKHTHPLMQDVKIIKHHLHVMKEVLMVVFNTYINGVVSPREPPSYSSLVDVKRIKIIIIIIFNGIINLIIK